jgi:hypothetical protein
MSEILFHYRKVDPTTWVYLSSLLTISLFFKFNRFWSVRNLDLALLILLAPGLLMVNQSRQEPLGSPAGHRLADAEQDRHALFRLHAGGDSFPVAALKGIPVHTENASTHGRLRGRTDAVDC